MVMVVVARAHVKASLGQVAGQSFATHRVARVEPRAASAALASVWVHHGRVRIDGQLVRVSEALAGELLLVGLAPKSGAYNGGSLVRGEHAALVAQLRLVLLHFLLVPEVRRPRAEPVVVVVVMVAVSQQGVRAAHVAAATSAAGRVA